MNKDCSQYREDIIDFSYGEREMDNSLQEHLRTCEECKTYFKELQQLKTELADITLEVPKEYGRISAAFESAREIEVKKENVKSLLLFIVVGAIILTSLASLAMAGYLESIIYFQLAMYTVMPILLPIIMKLRMKREEYES